MLAGLVLKFSFGVLMVGIIFNPDLAFSKAATHQAETNKFSFSSCTTDGKCIQISAPKAWEGLLSSGIATTNAKIQVLKKDKASNLQINGKDIFIDFTQNRIFIDDPSPKSKKYVYNLSSGELLIF